MDYLDIIAVKPPEKAALITEEHVYTYGMLTELAQKRRRETKGQSGVCFIKKQTIAEQLIEFIALSGTPLVPVLTPQEADTSYLTNISAPAEACMGVMTSGTTGRPKVLFRTFASWAGFFDEQNRVFGITQASCMFAQGSLAFTGNLNLYMGALHAGAAIAAADKFRPRLWQEMIARHNCDVVYLIPAKLRLLTRSTKEPLACVKNIIAGSQGFDRRDMAAVKRIMPSAEMTLYYGASELNYITYITGAEMTDDRTLIGRPFNGVGVSVKNGEIYIDTSYNVIGKPRPCTLGDCGSIDADGMLHFFGRRDDMYNINGLKISGLKVTDALLDCEGVEDAAVLPLHSNSGDMLAAFIVGKGLTKTLLLQMLRGKLTEHELPKRIIFMDALPKNESGKTDRKKLKTLLEK